MVIGRFNSITNSVPAGSIAGRAPKPVCDRYSCSDRSANQQPFAAARQSTDQHSAARSHPDFCEVLTVMVRAFELTFRIDVGAVAAIRVNERRRSA